MLKNVILLTEFGESEKSKGKNKEFNLQTIVKNYGVIMNSEFSSEDDEWKG